MKKLLILIGAAVLLFGCTGPMGPQGPQGPQGEGSQTFTLTYKLASADWVKNTDAAGNFIGWWHEIQMPELSTYVYEYGMYNVYLWDRSGFGSGLLSGERLHERGVPPRGYDLPHPPGLVRLPVPG